MLVRLTAPGGVVQVDTGGRAPGRGAYVCNRDCAQQAIERRALGRAFRRAVQASPNFVDSLELHG